MFQLSLSKVLHSHLFVKNTVWIYLILMRYWSIVSVWQRSLGCVTNPHWWFWAREFKDFLIFIFGLFWAREFFIWYSNTNYLLGCLCRFVHWRASRTPQERCFEIRRSVFYYPWCSEQYNLRSGVTEERDRWFQYTWRWSPGGGGWAHSLSFSRLKLTQSIIWSCRRWQCTDCLHEWYNWQAQRGGPHACRHNCSGEHQKGLFLGTVISLFLSEAIFFSSRTDDQDTR